jgi:hypothetical protein
MKIRTGFVSNSSSSSFVCSVCGIQESGWDMWLDDAGMHSCKKGHTFCDKHMTKKQPDLKTSKKKELLLSICQSNSEQDKRDREALNAGDMDLLDEMWEELKYEFVEYSDLRDSCDVEYCPCCNLTNPTDKQILSFLYKKLKTTKAKVVKEMRSAK